MLEPSDSHCPLEAPRQELRPMVLPRRPTSCKARRAAKLRMGCEDTPGYARLPQFDEWLWVGNQYSAAAGSFDAVISTITPLDLQGADAPALTTCGIPFEDMHGAETEDAERFARRSIVRGAAAVARALASGRRTLVHCEWGQNRSGSICCAYAVLYLGWDANKAIAYMRRRNKADRRYEGQFPMSNKCFNGIMRSLALERGHAKDGCAAACKGGSGGSAAKGRVHVAGLKRKHVSR
mmetsp:Transcript_33599/g.96397  ORF Transcript_33599/g.96397 Transcript_33599/m.96397 type:complete len:237 (-) Transcript_33599:136-846(-)